MQHAESPLPPAHADPHPLSPPATTTDDHDQATTTRGEDAGHGPRVPEGQQQGASQGEQDGAGVSTQGTAAQQGGDGARGPQGDAPAGEDQQHALAQEGPAAGVHELGTSVSDAQPGTASAQGGDRAGSALASTGDDESSAVRASAAPQDSPETPAVEGSGVVLEQPKPSNPARETSSLLAPPPPSLSVTDAAAPAADWPAPTPPPPSSSSPAPSTSAAAARTASPALSASPGPGATSSSSERPPPAKKFQSSLAVNKKFLEKAGEKAKPEVKPVISRVATSPAPTPISSTHPRLVAGKLSSGPSLSLGTGASSTSSSPATSTAGWGAKKPSTPTPGSSSSAMGAQGSSAAGGAGGAQGAKGGPVWGSSPAAGAASSSGPAPLGQQQEQRAAPSQASTQAYVPGGMRGGPHGGRGGPGGPGGWGGARNMEMDFPTAAEAANAKDARQKAVADQVQARERASQARATAAAAHNAHLLEELDAFRGVHLDPNATHWDEADDDDFLDTTIEFADGTQYKLDAAPSTPAGDDELREPGPRELALRERPLAPGVVVDPPRREERFGDDYDRSWPRRPSRSAGENRNLFNDRLGKLEPAASGAPDAAHPPPRRAGAEPTSILRSGAGAGTGGHSDLPPHLALGGHVPPPTSGRRPSMTSPRLNSHAPLHPVGRRESAHEPAARPLAWGGAGQRRPSSTAHAGPGLGAAAAGAQDRQLPPHLAARAAAAAQAPLSPSRGSRRPSVPAASAVLPTSPTRPAAAKQAQPLAAPPVADATSSAAPAPAAAVAAAAPPSAAPEAAAPPQPSIEELHAREMHAAAERARKRREEEEQKRLEQTERARKKAQELEEKMRAADEAKAKEKKEKEEAARPAPREREKERRPSVAAAQPGPPVAPADKATSWRAAAKPLPSQAAAASAAATGKASDGASSRRQARERPSASAAAPPPATVPEPTTILPRPSAPSGASASQQQPAAQPSVWRRSSASAAAPPAGPARALVRQLPPHLAAQAEAKAAAVGAATAAAPSPSPPAAEAAPPPSADLAKPSTPPPPPALALVSPPTSPSQDRKRQDPNAAAKHGYKLPAVSQFDDLMSRIKGVMTRPSEGASAGDTAASSKDEGASADAAAAKADVAAAEPVDAPLVEVPTVKLPPRTRAGKAAARAAAAAAHAATQVQQPVVSLPAPAEPRGRGRGRAADAPRQARQAAPVPAFESREPVLPYHSSRIPRSQSPPPAWRQYTIRLAAQPPRRPVAARVLKNFTNPGFPKPLYPFSWDPVLKDVNPRRLNRDDMLMPKKYDKHGKPIHVVALPKRRFSPRSSAVEPEVEPEIVVSISSVALVRQVAPEPAPPAATTSFEPAQPPPEGQVVDAGFAPFSGKPRGDGRAADAGAAWRREGGEGGAETAPFALSGASGQEAKFTGALNGEKIEATPRKVTTAPGRDANGLSKPPSSPPYKPQDLSQVASSPSAAASWTSKKLTYSALDPTASSVWSAAPEEGSVHARHIAASNLPENSLQGIVDEDPSEALPSSLAELKSEDGHSNADHKELAKQAAVTKDDAKLRAAAPSFSSFLHESAAAVDPSMSPSAAPPRHSQQQQQQHSYPGFPGQVAPQPSRSPIAGYSASHPFSPHLYAPQRPMSQQQQQHALYPGYPGQAPSPFATQPIHQAYASSPFVASPVPPTHGYPSPYRESASPALPHGITNPALIASYSSYGLQPQMAAPGGPGRGYGAVGAIGGPPGPGPIGRPPHHQQQQPSQQPGAPGASMYGRAQAPLGYHLGGGGGGGQYVHSFQHAHQQQHHQQQQHGGPHPGVPYRMDSYGSNDGRSSQQGGGPSGYGAPPPPSAGTTMASPVIMPQQLPPVPHFSPGHAGHHVPLGSPVASAQGMSMGASGMGGGYGHGYGQGGYGYPSQQQQHQQQQGRLGGGGQPHGRPPQAGGARW
ncbi:uncharacterized protein RHOBADRAFT_51866 [Rhodotorula graminis WP1]|uniref:Uncharacterized protein n=1 Tax=Rhodotorula graminis (strain WP1) TaxID=578459 RepID=A0A194SBV1_RHOGW|nr:uncharacterized protein RHOBADRAFT_51866 [Rhodotorula graminis WP1]KPV76881.1 hypothetical protein RHOBADRAFT_51866 [Rhodotorula graminis WP1]